MRSLFLPRHMPTRLVSRPLGHQHRALVRCARPSGTGTQGSRGRHAGRRLSTSACCSQQPKTFTRYAMPRVLDTSSPLPDNGKQLRQGKRTAYIALGSNMGDRISMIEQACNEMDARGIHVKRTSSLWETEPMYVLDQDRFINGACEVETGLEPLALLDQLQDIERSMGRNKLVDKGPRNIDLDILLYDNEKIEHERLRVPHAGIPEREFVLRPLAELIPHKPLDPLRPWKLTLDYLNELPPSLSPMTTVTPLSPTHSPLTALNPDRKTHIMAILNMTPDSFSDGGAHLSPSSPSASPASKYSGLASTIRAFVAAGATIIDVGGQSTRPGAPAVTAEEELARVLPAIRQLQALPEAHDVVVSIDTYRAAVAEAAVAAGADIINDVSAGALDAAMLPTAAKLGRTVVLMHMRGDPATMASLADYPEPLVHASAHAPPRHHAVVAAVAAELLARVAAAEAAGVRRWRIVLDPGLGFAKAGVAQNAAVLRHLPELRAWPGLAGLPWLVGSSRKAFVGAAAASGAAAGDPLARRWGTAATVAAAVAGGADVVRVHDVAEMAQVARVADAIWRV